MAVLCRSEGLPTIGPPQHPLGATPTFRLYECADGRWIQIACLQPEFFRRLVVALGLSEVLRDPRFEHVPHLETDSDREALIDVLQTRFREQNCNEWLRALIAHGVPCAPAQDARDLWHDPLFRDTEIIVERDDPQLGRVHLIGPLIVGDEHGTAAAPLPPLEAGQPPLEGIRVLELGGYQAAATACRLLADLGADVVKVEPPAGDPFRPAGNVFLALNHGKRSIVLDLATAPGQSAITGLAQTSAVVLHNLRPAVAERHGLGHAQLARTNPGVVSVQISGFGTDALAANRPAYDPLGAALSGVQRAQGGPAGKNPPSLVRTPVCDAGSGTAAAVAALAGLLGRLRHGSGTWADTSLIRVGAAYVAGRALSLEGRPDSPQLGADQYGTGPLCRLYATTDGWLFLVAPPEGWPRIRAALNLAADTDPAALAEALAPRSLSESLAVLRDGGAGATEVRTGFVEYFESDPQIRAQGLAAESIHPEYGKVMLVGPSVRLSLTPPRMGPPAPPLGAHTEALLAQLNEREGRGESDRSGQP
jgi:crotonobetainyl-CoA:carnitine CoA-transferase CaiB-like acyl-CoA transferase